MNRRKGTKPEQFGGPFQEYDQVPLRYRLETYSGQYNKENAWLRYRDEILLEEHDSSYMEEVARKAGESWLEHMEQRGRHHALATPEDVERWCQKLLSGSRNRQTCYEKYYVRIYQFYDFLKESYRHPHLYNPFILAAIEYESARSLWMYRIDTRPEVVHRE